MKEQILAVQRMQDFIENNKSEEISLSDLARASLFSPWYAYRLFRDYLGLTPTEYIRKYRLTQAAKQLRSGEVKVIDAAYDAGFTNVDTFTRAFYREFGLNPSDYMKYPNPNRGPTSICIMLDCSIDKPISLTLVFPLMMPLEFATTC